MKFLVVDDDPACREFLVAVLLPYGLCDLAFDGAEALDAFRLALDDGEPYDLICLDIMMPGVDGHKALDGIRTIEKEQGIGGLDGVKVIMTTAMRDSKHCIRSFREGCESYCTKPIEQDVLLGHIRNLLGKLPEPKPPRTENRLGRSCDARPPSPPSGGCRFLIVDDDGVCRELLKAILLPHGECTLAYDGQEAIDAVRLSLDDGKPFDLITLDIMMPGTSGHEALTGIRKLEGERGVYGSDGVKVIMTTALRDSKHCMQSFKEGCECYVTKPIDHEELMARVRELGVLQATEPHEATS